MTRRQQDLSRNISFLISVLVRYPEVSTVKYDPRERTICFTALVQEATDATRSAGRLSDALTLLNQLEGRFPERLAVETADLGGLTSFSVTRDIYTLTPEEVYTAIEFLRQEHPDRVISDPLNYAYMDEEWWVQEELIEEMLKDLGRGRTARNLLAFREEGRVVLFRQ